MFVISNIFRMSVGLIHYYKKYPVLLHLRFLISIGRVDAIRESKPNTIQLLAPDLIS